MIAYVPKTNGFSKTLSRGGTVPNMHLSQELNLFLKLQNLLKDFRDTRSRCPDYRGFGGVWLLGYNPLSPKMSPQPLYIM